MSGFATDIKLVFLSIMLLIVTLLTWGTPYIGLILLASLVLVGGYTILRLYSNYAIE